MPAQDHRKDRAKSLTLAYTIGAASDQELSDLFYRLTKDKRLSSTVHALNQLLLDIESRPHALRALRRLGLEYAG